MKKFQHHKHSVGQNSFHLVWSPKYRIRALKPFEIKIVRELDTIKAVPKKKTKKKQKIVEKESISIDDDVTITKLPDTPLMKIVQRLLQRREPEIVQVKKIVEADSDTYEVRGYSSNNKLLAIYRTVEKESIGVSTIRKFSKTIEEENITGIPMALLGNVKFTPTSKKEAQEANINLISLEDEEEAKGDEETQRLNERLRQGAIEIIVQRGYKLVTKTGPKFSKLIAGSESLGTYLIAENEPKDSLLVLLPSEEVVRVATVREFKEQLDSLKIDEGMLIALKRFTYTAEREAKDFGISALRKNHPVFNIFSHQLVPEHVVMSKDALEEMLTQYNAKLRQLPRIYEDDPGVVAVAGSVGDVVRIIRENTENYRLIVPRAEGGRTENTALVALTTQRRERLGNEEDLQEEDEDEE